jgi:hypothetical protein
MKQTKTENTLACDWSIFFDLTARIISLSLILFGSISCSNNKTENTVATGNEKKVESGLKFTSKKEGKVKFKETGGSTYFTLKFYDDGLKMLDKKENEIARITKKEDKYKIKDANDQVLGYVTGKKTKFKIKNSSQESTLFIFQRQQDGDWKLEAEDSGEQLLCKIGKRDYGWKIESGSETELGKVKHENGRISIQGSNGNTLFYSNDSFSGIAVVPFLLQQLNKPQQAALCAALNLGSN